MKPDERLKEFATPVQWAAYLACCEYGGSRPAEAALGKAHDSIGAPVRRMKAYAASKGYAPEHGMTETAPEGFKVKSVNTLYKLDPVTGQKVERLQWVKRCEDDERREATIKALFEEMKAELPVLAPLAPPPVCDTALVTIYPNGDPHAGLYASADETGAKFDLEEFEQVQKAAIDRLVASTPRSSLAIYNNKGDATHADNNKNRTPRSGHELDVHGRHTDVVRVLLRTERYHVARLLEKHERVIYRLDRGNHDPETALMLALMMEATYINEPRIEVVTSANPYWFFEFGKNLIGTCHGDGAKGKDLPLLMATDQPEAWGRTAFRIWIVGHVHHKDIKEYPGCTVEYVRTLAASDDHHHGAGYRSKRDMQAITLHREFGEVERHTCSLARINALAA